MAAATGPLTNEGARLGLVKALCAVAEGAAVVTGDDGDASCCTVAAALHDAQRRFAVLGGRDGMPRSVGSEYAGWAGLFLGSTFTGSTGRLTALSREIDERACRGVAVTRDGSLCFASCCSCIWVLRVHEGVVLQIVGRSGIRALEFGELYQICCAPDDFVFAAERANDRIHVLTPTLRFHSVVGLGQLDEPTGVCANLEEMVVSDRHQISVFRRRDEARLRRFGKEHLGSPVALCLMAAQRHVAVVDPAKKNASRCSRWTACLCGTWASASLAAAAPASHALPLTSLLSRQKASSPSLRQAAHAHGVFACSMTATHGFTRLRLTAAPSLSASSHTPSACALYRCGEPL